jgi:hypothetical protein
MFKLRRMRWNDVEHSRGQTEMRTKFELRHYLGYLNVEQRLALK